MIREKMEIGDRFRVNKDGEGIGLRKRSKVKTGTIVGYSGYGYRIRFDGWKKKSSEPMAKIYIEKIK